MSSNDLKSIALDIDEIRRRRREKAYIIALGLLFLFLTWIEFRLFEFSDSLPFVHSIFFFGLINFNIIILLLLMFLVFRNIVKRFSEKTKTVLGSTLKSKLIAAFVTFSFVPTLLMFLVSVFYINNSFDKWFSQKIAGVLKSSLEVTNAYYFNAKKRNYHFAHSIADEILTAKNASGSVEAVLSRLQKKYALDSVEYYPGLFVRRILKVDEGTSISNIPPISLEFLQKGLKKRAESSTIHHFDKGNLVRVIVPMPKGDDGAVVVSSFVPLSLISQMGEIQSAYEGFRNINPLEYPVKTIYLIILIMMTMVILLGATWFGFYLARQLTVPLDALVMATKKVAQGMYQKVLASSGSREINHLVNSFNAMTDRIEEHEKEIKNANETLTKALNTLDDHSRYVNVVLANVSTGVISTDQWQNITMVNKHASQLLGIIPEEFIGRNVEEVIHSFPVSSLGQLLEIFTELKAINIEREVLINLNERSIPLQIRVTALYDDRTNEIGKVYVFDDLSPVVRAQRAAAWTEVARRIAHEIKNPLTPIKLSAQRLQKKFGAQVSDEAFGECTRTIIEQVDDLKELVNEFSSFARLPQVSPQMNSLNANVETAIKIFESAHNKNIFRLELDQSLPEFLFDADQIRRVITNLVDNSLRAVKKTKYPKVRIKTEYDSELNIAKLIVEDNGEGIKTALRERIFEPYITTKPDGTGLGLAIVKRTIEDHNGFIRAYPTKPKGLTMLVELPVVTSANSKAENTQSLKGVDL